jgi:hypothetical protein
MISKHTFKKTNNNFYEKQKINNFWLYSAIILIEALFIYYCVFHIVAHTPFILSTFNHWPLVLFTLFGPTLVLLAYQVIRLDTIFNDDGIFYRWMPFSKRYKMIQWDAIREVSLTRIHKPAIVIWFSKRYDKVNFLGGKYAIILVMKSGKKRMLGTQKAESVNRVLTRLASKMYQPTIIEDAHDYRD